MAVTIKSVGWNRASNISHLAGYRAQHIYGTVLFRDFGSQSRQTGNVRFHAFSVPNRVNEVSAFCITDPHSGQSSTLTA